MLKKLNKLSKSALLTGTVIIVSGTYNVLPGSVLYAARSVHGTTLAYVTVRLL